MNGLRHLTLYQRHFAEPAKDERALADPAVRPSLFARATLVVLDRARPVAIQQAVHG